MQFKIISRMGYLAMIVFWCDVHPYQTDLKIILSIGHETNDVCLPLLP